jgi:isopenicillin N synthase-like dioxygenase
MIFEEVVRTTKNFDGSIEIVKDIAKRFEDYWDELMSSNTTPNKEYDYFDELASFVKKCLTELHDTYDLKEEDFDEEPEDEEQTFETEEDVRTFLTDVIRVLGWAFHPDDSFSTYINMYTDEYIYTQEEAEGLDALMDEAYDFCKEHDIDIYDLSGEICKELHGNLFDEDEEDDEDEDNDEPEYKIAGFDEAMDAYADAMDKFNKIMGRV